MRVLGFTGLAGSGKDFVAARIREMFPGSERIALADDLRIELEKVLAVPVGSSAVWRKPYSEPVRWLLQRYGTEFRRAADEDYWVRKTKTRIALSSAPVVTVTDVRFPNEMEMIHEFGGLVVKVSCDEGVRLRRLGGNLPPAHASERDLPGDVHVFNTTNPTAVPMLLEWLGLPMSCWRCTRLEPHTWHDDGSSWPEHAARFPNPPGHVESARFPV